MPTAAASPIERAHCRVEPASVYHRLWPATSAGRIAASRRSTRASSMKAPHQDSAEYWRPPRSEPKSNLEINFVPTEGTRLPIYSSGDLGVALFLRQLQGK